MRTTYFCRWRKNCHTASPPTRAASSNPHTSGRPPCFQTTVTPSTTAPINVGHTASIQATNGGPRRRASGEGCPPAKVQSNSDPPNDPALAQLCFVARWMALDLEHKIIFLSLGDDSMEELKTRLCSPLISGLLIPVKSFTLVCMCVRLLNCFRTFFELCCGKNLFQKKIPT